MKPIGAITIAALRQRPNAPALDWSGYLRKPVSGERINISGCIKRDSIGGIQSAIERGYWELTSQDVQIQLDDADGVIRDFMAAGGMVEVELFARPAWGGSDDAQMFFGYSWPQDYDRALDGLTAVLYARGFLTRMAAVPTNWACSLSGERLLIDVMENAITGLKSHLTDLSFTRDYRISLLPTKDGRKVKSSWLIPNEFGESGWGCTYLYAEDSTDWYFYRWDQRNRRILCEQIEKLTLNRHRFGTLGFCDAAMHGYFLRLRSDYVALVLTRSDIAWELLGPYPPPDRIHRLVEVVLLTTENVPRIVGRWNADNHPIDHAGLRWRPVGFCAGDTESAELLLFYAPYLDLGGGGTCCQTMVARAGIDALANNSAVDWFSIAPVAMRFPSGGAEVYRHDNGIKYAACVGIIRAWHSPPGVFLWDEYALFFSRAMGGEWTYLSGPFIRAQPDSTMTERYTWAAQAGRFTVLESVGSVPGILKRHYLDLAMQTVNQNPDVTFLPQFLQRAWPIDWLQRTRLATLLVPTVAPGVLRLRRYYETAGALDSEEIAIDLDNNGGHDAEAGRYSWLPSADWYLCYAENSVVGEDDRLVFVGNRFAPVIDLDYRPAGATDTVRDFLRFVAEVSGHLILFPRRYISRHTGKSVITLMVRCRQPQAPDYSLSMADLLADGLDLSGVINSAVSVTTRGTTYAYPVTPPDFPLPTILTVSNDGIPPSVADDFAWWLYQLLVASNRRLMAVGDCTIWQEIGDSMEVAMDDAIVQGLLVNTDVGGDGRVKFDLWGHEVVGDNRLIPRQGIQE